MKFLLLLLLLNDEFGLNRMMSDYKVDTVNDDLQMFYVTFHGPTDSNSLFAFFFFFFFLLAYKLLVEMP
jgi:hypothetical protein